MCEKIENPFLKQWIIFNENDFVIFTNLSLMRSTNIISTLYLFPIANHNFPAPKSRRMHPNVCEFSLLSHSDQITRFHSLSLLPLLQLFTKNLFTGFVFINFTQLQQTLQPVSQVTEFPITACISKHPDAFLLLPFYISVRDFICKASYAATVLCENLCILVRILDLHRGHPVLKRQAHLTSIFHEFYKSPLSVDGWLRNTINTRQNL